MVRSGRVLVVDDEVNARTALTELLRDEGYEVEMAADAFKALGKVETFAPHIVVTDLKMPGMDGLELVKKLQTGDEPIAVVVMTAFGAVQTAVNAMRAGAADYLTKPLNFAELMVVIDRVLETEYLRREAHQLRARVGNRVAPDNIIGNSPPMQQVFEIVDQVAPSRASVLITGESGTGKELIANALHQRSPRAKGPFIKLHCAALAESLLESELFGHERGSFTGAMVRKDGRFSLANGGTLFLDEIGEVSPAIQVKLLRFLQEHEFERVGGTDTIKVDVRVIAATNIDMKSAILHKTFREDLYYRLNVVPIYLPPMRERREDVGLLVESFLKRYAEQNRKEVRRVHPEAMRLLRDHDWPGNVRELQNYVERAVILGSGPELTVDHLPPQLRGETAPRPIRARGGDLNALTSELVRQGVRAAGPTANDLHTRIVGQVERELIQQVLASCERVQIKAAARLGINRNTLHKKLAEFRIDDGDSDSPSDPKGHSNGDAAPADEE